jgi:hypothetical protein
LCTGVLSGSLSLWAHLILSMRVTCPFNLTFLNLIVQTILSEKIEDLNSYFLMGDAYVKKIVCLFYSFILTVKNRCSSFGIATGYGLDHSGSGVRFLARALRPTQPPVQWVPGALFPGVKRPGRGANHSPSSRAGVKNAWSYTFTPNTPPWRRAFNYAQG